MGKQLTLNSLLTASCAVLAAATSDSSVFSKASNDSLLWGPYRSNLYFGVRPRIPKSLQTGLMWARVEDFISVQNNIRYTCEQNAGMAGYGWDVYDPRTGGTQTIHDRDNGIDITTSFVKFDEGRGGWGARIAGTPRDDIPPLQQAEFSDGGDLKTAVWFTVAAEGMGTVTPQEFESAKGKGYEGNVVFEGQTSDLGGFKLSIIEDENASHPSHSHQSYDDKPLDHTFVHSVQVPEEALWQGKGIAFNSMKTTIDQYVEQYTKDKMPPPWQTYTIQNNPGQGNFHLVQKVFEGPFQFDVFYTPADVIEKTSKDLTEALGTAITQFAKKFIDVNKPQAPFTDKKFLGLSRSMFSNLIGGLSYFYGNQVIDRSYAPEYEEENEGFWQEAEEARGRNIAIKDEGPYSLFTTVPSRPFFPRGFLWDEGFHLLPVLDWDAEIVMQIISSWFNTMDEDGWIPREQILGEEARSKVPPEFQIQYPHYANPPTLYIAIEALVNKLEGTVGSGAALNLGEINGTPLTTPESVKAWLKQLYPLLQRNFDWYKRTQWGDLKSYDREAFSSKEAYRWRGRTPRHILTSGLDDYPRAQPPHPGELHVDLLSWMGLMSRNIHRIAKFLGEAEDEAKYGKISDAIRRNVDDLHWSSEHKTYCDASIDAFEESALVCHKGYISIFPFMCGLLGPDHEHLKDVLELIGDEDELWSPHGIRSLSKKSEFYGTEENYWRSPVWMNMNYMIINQLFTIAKQSGPQQKRAAKLYTDLRKNLVETVYKSWQETGFAWEQYNPETGEGQRTQHFTGWTSLIVKILAMPELGKGGHDEL